MQYTIRLTQFSNREQLVELFMDFQSMFVAMDPLHRERCEPGYGEAYVDTMLGDNDGHTRVWVAVEGEAVIGLCEGRWEDATAMQRLSSATRRRGRITELFVAGHRRGVGIGGALLREAEQWLVDNGCDIVRIEVFAPNDLAIHFYESHGYHVRDLDMAKVVEDSPTPD